jgi:hypothetical protein
MITDSSLLKLFGATSIVSGLLWFGVTHATKSSAILTSSKMFAKHNILLLNHGLYTSLVDLYELYTIPSVRPLFRELLAAVEYIVAVDTLITQQKIKVTHQVFDDCFDQSVKCDKMFHALIAQPAMSKLDAQEHMVKIQKDIEELIFNIRQSFKENKH